MLLSCCVMCCLSFFFFKQKTAYEMRISDWSSDVCSSDLEKIAVETYGGEILFTPGDIVYSSSQIIENVPPDIALEKLMVLMDSENITFDDQIGRASCRERVCQYV